MATFSIAFVLLGLPFLFHSVKAYATQVKPENSPDAMVVSACIAPRPHLRRVGWGEFGLHFDVPTRETKILGGKSDVDYVRYIIKPKAGQGYLEVWFGPYAMNPNPEKELLANSVSSQKRSVVSANGEQIGTDNSGKLQTGEVWRHTFFMSGGMEGARYKTAGENVILFDRIINTACYIPYAKR